MLNQLFGRDTQDETYALVVVEDDRDGVRSITKLLSEAGYAVRTTTCTEGVDLLGKDPLPNGLIIDARESDMSVQEFVEKARVRFGRTALPPVLLLATSENGESLANLLEVDDYIPEPFDTDNLLERVQQLV